MYKGSGVNVTEITSWIDTLLLTNVEVDKNRIPEKTYLYQNFPNPFNPITTLKFKIQQKQHVRLEIFDINGKLIRKLIDNELYKGSHEVLWDGKDKKGKQVSSGIYFYKLRSGRNYLTKKMTLLR